MATIICVTSCITGIAHTYMAAEALEQAGKKLGHNVMVETQGAAGSNPFSQEVVDTADAVIFAVDLEVQGKDRFNGKPYIQVPVAKAMKDAVSLVEQVLAAAADGTAGIVGEKSPAKPASEKSADSDTKPGGFFGGLFGKGK
jgi:PTS system fructose-specific IIB component